MEHPPKPTTNYSSLDGNLKDHDADAFVHIGTCFDELLQYLTRFNGPDREYAFIYVDGTAVLCSPRLFKEQAIREFSGDQVRGADEQNGTTAAERSVEVLQEFDIGHQILIPPTVSTDSVSELEEAGYTLTRTEQVNTPREQKTAAEQRCLQSIQTAAQKGMARAETVLSDATISNDTVIWQGKTLTTEILRREINAVLSQNGVQDAGNTVIGAGPTCADLHFTGNDEIRPNETVLIDISPRGPHKYYGDITRTFTVGGPSTWAKDTYQVVKQAQDTALSVLESGAGLQANTVHQKVVDVFDNHGIKSGQVDVGFYHGIGHGVGVSLHEKPSLTAEQTLSSGNIVTIEPGIYDPDTGGVRLEDLVVVTENGYTNLTDYPRSIIPENRV